MSFFMIFSILIMLFINFLVLFNLKFCFQMSERNFVFLMIIFLLIFVLGFLSLILTRKFESQSLAIFMNFSMYWFGFLSIVFTFFLIANIVSFPLYFFLQKTKTFLLFADRFVFVLAMLCAIYSSLNALQKPSLVDLKINISSLKTQSLKIIHLTDLHIDGRTRTKEIEYIIKKTNEFIPDIILITGDVLDTNKDVSHYEALFRDLKAKYGVFATTGNHEYYPGLDNFKNFCRGANIKVLENEVFELQNLVNLIGINDKAALSFSYKLANLPELFSQTNPSLPKILLSHRPEVFDEAAKLFVDLQLSGHTHAGQIPPIDLIEKIFFKYVFGLYKSGNSNLYLSSGTRFWGPRMRFLSKSEIVRINLTNEKTNEI